ncbi:MAG: hypothetical protein R3C17_07305 [Planctomycetaceae bacterium]
MQKVSSSNYPLTRLVIPVLSKPKVWATCVVLMILLVISGLWLLLLPMFLLLSLFAAIHFSPNIVFNNFCKDVWADDTELLLQLKEEQVRLPFDQIEKVTYHSSNNPPRAKITLKTANRFGSVFTFIPDLSSGRQQARKNIEALNKKTGQ